MAGSSEAARKAWLTRQKNKQAKRLGTSAPAAPAKVPMSPEAKKKRIVQVRGMAIAAIRASVKTIRPKGHGVEALIGGMKRGKWQSFSDAKSARHAIVDHHKKALRAIVERF